MRVETVRKPASAPRSPGHSGPLVESYFAKLNSPDGGRALWLKFTASKRSGGSTLAEAWAVAFQRGQPPVASKRAWQLAESELSAAFRGAEQLELGVCRLDASRTSGELASPSHIGWQLSFQPARLDSPLSPLPRAFYRESLPTSKLVSQHPDLRFSGSFHLGEQEVDVSSWRGMLGHNWGRRHTPGYAWLHCNQFREDSAGLVDCVLEAVSAPLLGRRLGCAVLRLPGMSLTFGFCDWRAGAEARSPTSWSFCVERESARLDVEVQALESETAGLRYANPTAGGVDCLNSKLARVSLVLERRCGASAGRWLRLVSDAGALEHGFTGAHPVRMLL